MKEFKKDWQRVQDSNMLHSKDLFQSGEWALEMTSNPEKAENIFQLDGVLMLSLLEHLKPRD